MYQRKKLFRHGICLEGVKSSAIYRKITVSARGNLVNGWNDSKDGG
jgi:hypothetical protein